MKSNEHDLSRRLKTIFEEHLSQTIIWFEDYYNNQNFNEYLWIQSRFNTSVLSILY